MTPALALMLALATPDAAVEATDTTAIDCGNCEKWNVAHAPFHLVGNAYYVGTDGLSSVLVVGEDGLVLIDGALPQSAPHIADSIRALGYRVEDIRWIVNSHTHFDHAGGIAALQRMSGARVAASPRSAEALRAGRSMPDDPQAGSAAVFPAVAQVTLLADGEPLTLGDIVMTPHFTPGHTPGGTTWSWRTCQGGQCWNLVYADSLTPVSADDFRFSDDPDRVTQFRRSIAAVRNLPCDVLVSAHPDFSSLFERQAARVAAGGSNPLVDTHACRAYADDADRRLDQRLSKEAAAK